MTTAPTARTGLSGWRGWTRLLAYPFRWLVTGQILSQGSDGLAQVAFAQVVLFEVGRGVSPWELAKVLSVMLIPFSIVGPVAGAVVDRWDRRRTLVVVSLARAAIVVASLSVLAFDSQALGYLALAVLLSSSRFVVAAKGASLPRTVPAAELVTANAVSAIAGMSAAFVGAAIGAGIVAVAPGGGFVVAAAGYLAASTAFGRLGPVGGGTSTVSLGDLARRAAAEIAEGVHAAAARPDVRRPLLALLAHRFLLGAAAVVLVLVADARYGYEVSGYALALAIVGIGAFAGTWAAPTLARRYGEAPLLPAAFLVSAAIGVVAGADPVLVMLVGAVVAAAAAFQVLKVVVDAMLQQASPDAVRGRVFSLQDLLYNGAFAAAALALVPLWQEGSERRLLWLISAASAGVAWALARAFGTWPHRPAAEPPVVSPRRRWLLRAGAAAAGAVPVLAFPEADLAWLGAVGLVPWLALVVGAPTAREASWLGWAGGTGFFVAMHHWLLAYLSVFALVVGPVLGLLWLPIGRLAWHLLRPPVDARRAAAALALLPAAWVTAEFLRSWDRLAGPWGLLGASQWQRRWVLDLASLGGVWLVSAVLVAVNVVVLVIVSPRVTRSARVLAGVVGVALVLSTAGYAAWGPRPSVTGSMRVAGVQVGHIPDGDPRFDAHLAATASLAGQDVDLVVWPESSVGFDLEDRPDALARLVAVATDLEADVLVNVDARRGPGGIFKSSLVVGPDGIGDRYDKQRLVPFGEYIPLRPVLGWLSRVTLAADEDRQRGEGLAVVEAGGHRVGPLVCFESAFPDLARELADMGAELIVLQTATTSFSGTWGQPQHASLAAVRAVESGRPVVHSAVDGVSAVFGADARRRVWLPHGIVGTWVVDLPLTSGTTPYVRLGDWVPVTAIAVLLLAAATVNLRAGGTRTNPGTDTDGAERRPRDASEVVT